MSKSVNYGSRRTVVGAGYGMRDWLSQRITAVLMALFTVVLIVRIFIVPGEGGVDYYSWSQIFNPQWMKFLTFSVIASLALHVWVGIRDVWMDYVKPVGLRLALQVFTIVYLVGCAGWAVQVIWRL